MTGILKYTRQQLRDGFSANLPIKDKEIRSHVVNVLDSFVHERSLPIKEVVMDSVKVNDLFERKEFMPLVHLGDTYMFMLGFFPEYCSGKRRFSMGIQFYIEKGVDSYNYAVALSYHETDQPISTGLVSKLSDNVKPNARAIIEMRRRFRNGEVVLDQEVCKELEAVLDYQPDFRNLLVIIGGSNCKDKKKYTDEDGYLSVIEGDIKRRVNLKRIRLKEKGTY
jgi:hypothetical protein